MKTWNEKARQRLQELGLKQEELAEPLGVEPAAVGHYLTGLRKPKPDQLRKLAITLQCSLDWLFGLKAEQAISPPTLDLFRAFLESPTTHHMQAIEQAISFLEKSKNDNSTESKSEQPKRYTTKAVQEKQPIRKTTKPAARKKAPAMKKTRGVQ